MNENRITAHAEIIAETSSNKAGKPMGADYFLKDGSEKYFIKMMACPAEVIPKIKLGKYIVSYETKEGLWDTEDPDVQSRVGDYVVIYAVEKIE